jgi:dolichyl-diphosphooligosaccharide--protein glycosyltransferase
MADYVLVWSTQHAGIYGDDLAKMPHMARIAGSVFDDIDPKLYSLSRERRPSPKMASKSSSFAASC